MTALSDALAAAQARGISTLGKVYVRGTVERDAVIEQMDAMGCSDVTDRDALLAAWDVLRDYGAALPAERTNGTAAKPEDEKATDAQLKLIRKLCDERAVPYPGEPITKAQAHEIIDTLKAGTYDADKWSVPF